MMFQTEIKFITDFTLNYVKKLGAFFTFERLLETNIHPAIKQYVNGEFEFLIYEDRQKLIQGSLFDYSGSKINHHFSMIAEEIKKTKKVSYEDIKILISRAVSFNVNYVLKPNWALQKLVFGEKKNIPVAELELVLNYLYYYDHLKNVLKAYLTKRNILTLSTTEFELILNKIDRELFSAHFEKLVDNSLVSIADLFSIGGLNKKNISVEAVEVFLKEKNLIDHLLKLKRAIPDPGKRKYDLEDIRRIIYSVVPVEPESISPVIEEPESETDGEFEKVKTLEETQIKPFTQTDEVVEEEQKSDENIIQELVQDEIVKKDIEELIIDEEPAEKIIQERVPEVQSGEESIWEDEILPEKKSEIYKTDEPKKPVENLKDKDDVISVTEAEGMVISPFLESSDQKEEDADILSTSEDENSKNEQEKQIVEDESDIIEDPELLSEKEEEELFSFYEEELKDLDSVPDKEDEAISIEDIQPEVKKTEEKIEEEIIDELESVIKDEYTVNFDELGIEDEEIFDDIISETEISEKLEPEIEEKVKIEKVKAPEPEVEKESVEEKIKEKVPAARKKKPRDVFSFLTSKEIDKITDAIFNSDSEDFANTIERISECEDYQKATEILKALFISSKISPQSKQAVTLTNAVANYFDQV